MADLRPILDPVGVDRATKADAWDAFHAASDPDDFRTRFDRLNLPRETKAALWDAKFGEPKPAAPAAKTTAAQSPGTELTGLPGVPVRQPDVRQVRPDPFTQALDVAEGFQRGAVGMLGSYGGAVRAATGQLPLIGPVMEATLGHGVREIERVTKTPEWLEDASQNPGRWTDPAFILNLALQGAGSSAGSFIPGRLAMGPSGKIAEKVLRTQAAARVAAKLPAPLFRTAARLAGGTVVGAFMETLADA